MIMFLFLIRGFIFLINKLILVTTKVSMPMLKSASELTTSKQCQSAAMPFDIKREEGNNHYSFVKAGQVFKALNYCRTVGRPKFEEISPNA